MTDSSSPTHPTDETVAAYLEGLLPPPDRTVLETHLGACEYCRARVVLASRALETAPSRRFPVRRRPMLVALLAAASLAGVLLLSRSAAGPVARSEIRAAEQEAVVPAVRIVGPRRGTTVEPATLRFIWSALAPDALYQVTVSAADGRMIWSARTADTIAAPPREVLRQLQPGRHYFWRVDALLSNLRSVTSADQPFQVSPR